VLAYPSRDPINATELHETWFLPFFSVVPSYAALVLPLPALSFGSPNILSDSLTTRLNACSLLVMNAISFGDFLFILNYIYFF
jgi:hypothetical protein